MAAQHPALSPRNGPQSLSPDAALSAVIAPPMDLDPAVSNLRLPFWQLRLLHGTMPAHTERQHEKLQVPSLAFAYFE